MMNYPYGNQKSYNTICILIDCARIVSVISNEFAAQGEKCHLSQPSFVSSPFDALGLRVFGPPNKMRRLRLPEPAPKRPSDRKGGIRRMIIQNFKTCKPGAIIGIQIIAQFHTVLLPTMRMNNISMIIHSLAINPRQSRCRRRPSTQLRWGTKI